MKTVREKFTIDLLWTSKKKKEILFISKTGVGKKTQSNPRHELTEDIKKDFHFSCS